MLQSSVGGAGGAPIQVVYNASERQFGRQAQLSNIEASKAIADTIRTCLGPRAMLKMLLDPMGSIVVTNDGHAILREIDAMHPAAKSIMEACRTQDEEVGDGTTSVVVLTGELLAVAEPLLSRHQLHPLIIINGYHKALEECLKFMERMSKPINVENDSEVMALIHGSIGTKMAVNWSDMICKFAMQAVRVIADTTTSSTHTSSAIDIKKFIRVERVPGGDIEDSRLLMGVVLNKDILHASMRRQISNPRILLIDCPLEYKKGESQTNLEVKQEGDWSKYLQLEEDQVKEMCSFILALKPDLVISEKGISDLAQHYLVKANITALRRAKKTELNRLARATGATIVSRLEDARESDLGLQCTDFHIEKIGDEYFAFIDGCKNAKACTILLRGPSKDVLAELERNLQDAMADARNILINPCLLPGGGATEVALSMHLESFSKNLPLEERLPLMAVAAALEIIPRTLIQNCGANVIRTITELRAKHASESEPLSYWGINGHNGSLQDMSLTSPDERAICEPFSVKSQCLKTAIECSSLILRVDDIVAARTKERDASANPAASEDQSRD